MADPGAVAKRSLAPIVPTTLHALVLGSLPSDQSLAKGEYYGNPRNRFWFVMAACGVIESTRAPYRQRIRSLTRRGVGLWDLYASAMRPGSSDSAIRRQVANDIGALWEQRGPFTILLNGKRLREWRRHFAGIPAEPVELPSTSPRPLHWNESESTKRAVAVWRTALRSAGVTIS